MISFLFRTAFKSALVQRYRFVSLMVTIAIASALLVTLASLYVNAESRLALELSGIPNMVMEPKTSVVALSRLTADDVVALKSTEHFWRNNIVNAAPIMLADGEINGRKVKVAGTWFEREITADNKTYTLGLLKFKGWQQTGEKTEIDSIVVGANVSLQGETSITVGGSEKTFKVAKTLDTGSYWDDYIFMDLDVLKGMTRREELDQILVSSLIKPKDKLALKAETSGIESLTPDEFTAWYCSPYTEAIAYTIKEVVPQAEVKIQRRITEVQEGIIKASSSIFVAMFLFTLISSITAIFAGEKMYISSKMREFGVMAAIGASKQKIFLQLMTEIGMAALLSGGIAYGLSQIMVKLISRSVFGITFEANTTLIITSISIPFLASLASLIFVKKGLERNVVELLR